VAAPWLSLREAVALGLLQGPTELLPVSSSAHTELLPWLAGWRYAGLDADARKTFEVALHGGAGLALALDMRRELLSHAARLDVRHAAVIVLSLAPPALAGYVFERPIERRLGGPAPIAAGLLAGALALAAADAGTRRLERSADDAGPLDGLALGLAQAAALAPGISRSGATLAAARMRGFRRRDAHALSWHAALPVILGACTLKAVRSWRSRAASAETRAGTAAAGLAPAPVALGALGAFASTLASGRALRAVRASERSLLPYAVYRCVLAALVIARMLAGRSANAPSPSP